MPVSCFAFESVNPSQTNILAIAAPSFQFPLHDIRKPFFTSFAAYGSSNSGRAGAYHAAEDYLAPAGTPVYAFTEGTISYSGPMGGYGWLIIVDHADIKLYSLYGHLSPSRWSRESGIVKKGELIAYLGDPDENGGTALSPLTPHLHFGVRVGQRGDYPNAGDWRWQAGWVKSDPQSMGWLQPSRIIAEQAIPDNAFVKPRDWFFKVWGSEILLTSLMICPAVWACLVANRKRKPLLLVLFGAFYGVLAWAYFARLRFGYGFIVISFVLLAAGVYGLVPRLVQSRLSGKTRP